MSCAESYIGPGPPPHPYYGEWSSGNYLPGGAAPYPPTSSYGHIPPPSTSHHQWTATVRYAQNTSATAHSHPASGSTSSAPATVPAATSAANTYKWMHIKRTVAKPAGLCIQRSPAFKTKVNRKLVRLGKGLYQGNCRLKHMETWDFTSFEILFTVCR